MIIKSPFAKILRPQLREIMRNYDSKFYNRPRRVQIDSSMLLGFIFVIMWGVIVYLLWDIHTLVSLNQQSLIEIVRGGLVP